MISSLTQDVWYFGNNHFMSKHTFNRIKSFSIPISIGCTTLAYMLNGCKICLITKILSNCQYARFHILTCGLFWSAGIPTMIKKAACTHKALLLMWYARLLPIDVYILLSTFIWTSVSLLLIDCPTVYQPIKRTPFYSTPSNVKQIKFLLVILTRGMFADREWHAFRVRVE